MRQFYHFCQVKLLTYVKMYVERKVLFEKVNFNYKATKYKVSVVIGNIKRKFPPKTGMREKQVLQDPGYVDTVDTCCMLHAMR